MDERLLAASSSVSPEGKDGSDLVQALGSAVGSMSLGLDVCELEDHDHREGGMDGCVCASHSMFFSKNIKSGYHDIDCDGFVDERE